MGARKRLSFLPEDDDILKQSISDKDNEHKKSLRYRIEQKNATRIGRIATFNSDIRKEYIVDFDNSKHKVHCKLVDYVYELDPKDFEKPLSEMKSLEYSKDDVIFSLSKNLNIVGVENLTELKTRWDNFKKVFVKSVFFNEIKNTNPKAANDILERGDLEFSNEKILIETYYKNLFFHILFKNYSDTNFEESMSFLSQIFHNTTVNLKITNALVREENNDILYRSVGIMDSNSLNQQELIRQYNELYKPTIKYNYSEYSYDYRITRNVNRYDNEIESARAILIEKVKNNYELISEFNLKRIEL